MIRFAYSVSPPFMKAERLTAAILMFATMLLSVPLRWLAAAFVAALLHEFGHYISVRICGGTIDCMRFGPTGAIMEVSGLAERDELLSLAAGPVAGLLTMLLMKLWPQLAFCGFVQSMYNLLPIYPLDGGRILNHFVQRRGGSDKQIRVIEYSVIAILALSCVLIRVYYGISLFIFVLILLFRKTPCKHHQDCI